MKKLYVAILYHHHQPLYKDPLDNYYHLPWVKFHATKDYYDMATWVEKFPKLKLNFNFVPSLLVQLEDYSRGAKDKYLELTLKPSTELTVEDKLFILKNFFNCNWETMVYPYRRYRELLEKRGKNLKEDEILRKITYFNHKDWTDLQVWYNLVWFDPYWRKNDLEIKALFEKQEGFTQEDKYLITNKQSWICGEIIKKYKQLQQENKIEISFSAFYHPILPLLLNPQNAKISAPHIKLPSNAISLLTDAEKQIEIAKKYYEEKFGISPKGFWPSEGAVSDDLVYLLKKFKIRWFATDEDILAKTLIKEGEIFSKDALFTPYRFYIDEPIYVIFRNKELSNNISFVYYKWKKEDAIKDIELKLTEIYNLSKNKDFPFLVSIILDGENCWEYYQNDGEDFLYAFYEMLTSNEIFETVLIDDYLSKYPKTPILKNIWPGSWINSNYEIWIGHPEDNKAWEYLYKTREFLQNFLINNQISKEKEEFCWQEIYAAEGSDWFWWFGDEHYSYQSDLFDFLFRQHLKNVYIALQQEYPNYLDIPIKINMVKNNILVPSNFITPTIDGKISNYFEWVNSGKYIRINFSQHRTNSIADSLYYGFDLKNIYIRIDYHEKLEFKDLVLNICFISDLKNNKAYNFKINLDEKDKKAYKVFFPNGETKEVENNLAIDRIIEIKVPFILLETKPHQQIVFFVNFEKKINEKLVEIQRLPENGFIEIFHPDETYFKMFWTV
ncbi:MAG: glycoside hydrolase family 57 protein [Endomicrobiia bacterium]